MKVSCMQVWDVRKFCSCFLAEKCHPVPWLLSPSCRLIKFFSLAHISAYLVKNRIFKTSKYFGQGIEDCYMVEWHGINNADQSKCIKFGCIFITDMEHPYSSSLKFTTLTINYLFCNPNSNSKKSWGHFRSRFGSKYFQNFQIFFSLWTKYFRKFGFMKSIVVSCDWRNVGKARLDMS